MAGDLEARDGLTGTLTPYRRGVSLKEIAKSALTRFLPASLVSMLGIGVGMNVSVSGAVLSIVGGVLGFAGLMTLGFGAGLIGLRRWLYPDAEVAGRRSVVAGLLSPLALFISAAVSSGMNQLEVVATLFVVGVLLALGMFFAWLTPTPAEMLPAKYLSEAEEPAAVPLGPAS